MVLGLCVCVCVCLSVCLSLCLPVCLSDALFLRHTYMFKGTHNSATLSEQTFIRMEFPIYTLYSKAFDLHNILRGYCSVTFWTAEPSKGPKKANIRLNTTWNMT